MLVSTDAFAGSLTPEEYWANRIRDLSDQLALGPNPREARAADWQMLIGVMGRPRTSDRHLAVLCEALAHLQPPRQTVLADKLAQQFEAKPELATAVGLIDAFYTTAGWQTFFEEKDISFGKQLIGKAQQVLGHEGWGADTVEPLEAAFDEALGVCNLSKVIAYLVAGRAERLGPVSAEAAFVDMIAKERYAVHMLRLVGLSQSWPAVSVCLQVAVRKLAVAGLPDREIVLAALRAYALRGSRAAVLDGIARRSFRVRDLREMIKDDPLAQERLRAMGIDPDKLNEHTARAIEAKDETVLDTLVRSKLLLEFRGQKASRRAEFLAQTVRQRQRQARFEVAMELAGRLLAEEVMDKILHSFMDANGREFGRQSSVLRYLARRVRRTHAMYPRLCERLVGIAGGDDWRRQAIALGLMGEMGDVEAFVSSIVPHLEGDPQRENGGRIHSHALAALQRMDRAATVKRLREMSVEEAWSGHRLAVRRVLEALQ